MDEHGRVIYRTQERLVIIGEHELDYEVENIDTGAKYIIDKTYFRRKYIAEAELKSTN